MVGRPELATDPRFLTFTERGENADVLIPILEEIFLTRRVDQWLPELRKARIPSAPIHDIPQALADDHTKARGLIVSAEHPKFGSVEQLISPVRVGTEPPTYRRAPQRGEDGEQILRDILGYDEDRIRSLIEKAPDTAPGPVLVGKQDQQPVAGV